MGKWSGVVGLAAGLVVASAAAAEARPHFLLDEVPGRTVLVVDTPHLYAESAGADEPRPALSTVKIYLADYVIRYGDGAEHELDLARRAVTASDDGAAEVLFSEYPQSIDVIVDDYGLSQTSGNDYWGIAQTSPRDAVRFLRTLQHENPDSRVLEWMAESEETAADGTPQDWGSAVLPGVEGTKWGWSDSGISNVSSSSYGRDFAVAAHTYGDSDAQTGDLRDSDIDPLLARDVFPEGIEMLVHPADPDLVGWGSWPVFTNSAEATDTELFERAARGGGTSSGGGDDAGAGSDPDADDTAGAGTDSAGALLEKMLTPVSDLR